MTIQKPTPPTIRPWWRRHGVLITAAVVIVGGLLFALGRLTPATPTPAASGPPGPSTPTGLTTEPPAPVDTLTGYGATIATWDGTHTPDTDFDPGTVYDPDPSLPTVYGNEGARYVSVQPVGGRVTNYTENLGALTLANAESVVGREFPADTRVLWSQQLTGCTQVELASPTLHRVLGDTGTGDVQVEYFGGPAGYAMLANVPGAKPDPTAFC